MAGIRPEKGRISLRVKVVKRPAAWCSPDISPPVGGNAGSAPSVGRVVKLSVVVPFFNVQTYAPDTLTSLRANAREDFEFLLVDDCSSDGTPELLERAARELPGAVLIRHERNEGLATARNTGLDAARGEYLTFLDGDDWLAPGYYERLVAAAEGLGCDFLRTDHVSVSGRDRAVHRAPVPRRGEVLDPGTRYCPPTGRPRSTTRTRGPGSTTGSSWSADSSTSRTGCGRPRTGPGSGSCTARRNRSRRSGNSASSTGAESRPRSPRSATSANWISSAHSTR